eukprot:CAMPEP_0185028822 /NCGR_PEP_ID=MMETSP1103-20130426/14844_1 /TAXON_ID=36769 /ORGANISM="Paraphysomonas bandaiensis, Strain Caron Lab Isolate" /LENGTH=700 /DNA_ID=CAMNT_0027563365 /DNA_START=809 /DNA_END=2911 /DNA_ORIENTATION=+
MGMAVADVLKTQEAVEALSDPDINGAVNTLVKECPHGFSSSTLGKVAVDSNNKVTINSLAKLRGRLYYLNNAFVMAQGKVEEAKVSAYRYEDIIAAMCREDGVRRIQWSFTAESSEAEYMWEVKYKPLLYRAGAVMASCLSVFSYLGILGTMPNVARVISVYYHAVHDNDATGAWICLFVLLTLVYTTYVAMWSIFQMRIADMMELLPGQKTAPNSLSVNARVCAKFAAPLCFFYLGWIFENGTKTGVWTEGMDGSTKLTAFARFYQIQVIPVVGDSFNSVFPIIIFCISVLVATNTINRVLVFLKLEKFQFGSEILTEDQLREGRRQLARHKRLMERSARRASLKARIETAKGGVASVVAALPVPVKSLFSSLRFWRRREYDGSEELQDLELADNEEEDVVPNILKGWGERKESKTRGLSVGAWQRRYMVAEEPGTLYFYRDAGLEKEMDERLDLRDVTSFLHLEGKDNNRVNIELVDGEIKLRFQTDEDAAIWVTGLEEWKAYAAEHESLYDEADHLDISDLCVEDEEAVLGVPKSSPISPTMNPLIATAVPDSIGQVSSYNESSSLLPQDKVLPPVRVTSSDELFKKPDPLEGWLEKKKHGSIVSQWQRRYFRILPATAELAYYSSDRPDEKPSVTIDLKQILSVDIPNEGGSIDSSRFNIETQERNYKLKAISHEDGLRWVDGLNEWRDYTLLNMK